MLRLRLPWRPVGRHWPFLVRGARAASTEEVMAKALALGNNAAGKELSEVLEACSSLQPLQLRDLLRSFADASTTVPPQLWEGLSAEVPRAAEELDAMHLVHLALLLSSLSLREPPHVMQEVAAQLEQRAHDLPPAGLVGAVVALSQLGPWLQDPQPGGSLITALEGSLFQLPPSQLSSVALSVATLQHEMPVFWQQAHGALLACAKDLSPRQLADVYLALATHQMCPITLLEELHGQLPRVLHEELPTEEALTIAWSMVAMRFTGSGHLLRLLEHVAPQQLGVSQVHQLQQIILSLEQETESSAPKRCEPWFLEECPSHGQVALEVLREVCEHLEEVEGIEYSLNETVEDFYRLDLSIKAAKDCALVLDPSTTAMAEAPRNAWITLKCRHLKHLGWCVEWLPLRRWEMMSTEERAVRL